MGITMCPLAAILSFQMAGFGGLIQKLLLHSGCIIAGSSHHPTARQSSSLFFQIRLYRISFSNGRHINSKDPSEITFKTFCCFRPKNIHHFNYLFIVARNFPYHFTPC